VHVSFVKRFCPSRSTILPATCTCDFVIGKRVCFILFFLTKIGMFFEVSKQPEKTIAGFFFFLTPWMQFNPVAYNNFLMLNHFNW